MILNFRGSCKPTQTFLHNHSFMLTEVMNKQRSARSNLRAEDLRNHAVARCRMERGSVEALLSSCHPLSKWNSTMSWNNLPNEKLSTVNPDGEIVRHKAQLVARGFTQVAGVDYNKMFVPVAKFDLI